MAERGRRRAAGGAVYSRTRPEYLALVARWWVFGTLGAGAACGVVWVILGGINNTLARSLSVPGVGTLAVVTVSVGLLTAGTVGVLARPRVLRARDTGRTSRAAGHGRLWTGPVSAAQRGPAGHNVAPGVKP